MLDSMMEKICAFARGQSCLQARMVSTILQGVSDQFMVGSPESKIASFSVANLGNSWTITCDPRLEADDLGSQFCSTRINQRLLWPADLRL